MDKAVMTQAMKVSISEVLEQMFFMPVDFCAREEGDGDHSLGEEVVAARLGFVGTPGGVFILQIPMALARSVTADFLGTPPDKLSGDQVLDTVLEMTNMLAGSTLSTYDHKSVFDLGLPELVPAAKTESAGIGKTDRIVIAILTLESRMTFELVAH